MLWRVWLLRTIVCSSCVAVSVLGWLTYLHTNSEAIRLKVIEELQTKFAGVEVEIGSAWLRPLGGISVRDLRLARRDDPTHPFLTVQAATVFHDKEQLAHGRLVIRKLELDQPTLLIRRDVEGSWNLAGLTRPGRVGDDSGPTVVIHKGVIRYENRTGGVNRPIIEVIDVNCWTLPDDTQPATTFQGEGRSVLGKLKWAGTFRRDQVASSAVVEFPGFDLSPELIRDLARHVPEVADHVADFQARGQAKLELRYQPGSRPEWQPDLRVTLHDGRFRHPRLPLPVNSLELTARYHDNQISVERCQAESGSTRVQLSLDAPPSAFGRIEELDQLCTYLSASVQNLTLSDDLFSRLPAGLHTINREFKPAGPVSLTYEVKRGDSFWSKRWVVKPEGMSAAHEDFSYPLKGLRGTLVHESNSLGADRMTIDLTGTASNRPLTIVGKTEGDGPTLKVDVKMAGQDLPLDETLLAALGANRHYAEPIHPTGRGDFVAVLRRHPGDTQSNWTIRLDLHDMAICYDEFPYPLEDMAGTLHITLGPKKRLVFESFKGRHHGGEMTINGVDDIGDAGNVLTLDIHGVAVPFDAELARAVARLRLQSVWRTLGPRGRLGFTARVTRVDTTAPPNMPKPPNELELTFPQIHADSILPDFLPYELTDVTTSVRYAKNVVTMTELVGRHGPARVLVGPSEIIVKPAGGIWGRFSNLQITPLIPDEDFLRALPSGLRSAVTALEPTGPIALSTRMLIVDTEGSQTEAQRLQAARQPARDFGGTVRLSQAPLAAPDESPWIYWEDLAVRFAGASLKLGVQINTVFGEVVSRGEYRHGRLGTVDGNLDFRQAELFRQPLTGVHARLVIDAARQPDKLQVQNFKADVFGGSVVGSGWLRLGPMMTYGLDLNAVQLKLDEIARQNRLGPDAQISGRAMAKLYLEGRGDDVSTLQGGGTIDIPQGRIYNLPPLLDLLKFLKLHAPDGTAFEEAHAQFTVRGNQAHFKQLDLIGSLISLTGEGDVNLDGSNLRLDVYPIWTRFVQALPGPVRDGASAISRGLFKVEMRGNIGGALDYSQEAVPVVVEPVRRLAERLNRPWTGR